MPASKSTVTLSVKKKITHQFLQRLYCFIKTQHTADHSNEIEREGTRKKTLHMYVLLTNMLPT